MKLRYPYNPMILYPADSPMLDPYLACGAPIYDCVGELIPRAEIAGAVVRDDYACRIISRHRIAWRAVDAARKAGDPGCVRAYAVLADGSLRQIIERRGDTLPGEIALSDTMIVDGHQYYRNPQGQWLRRQSQYSHMPTLAIKAQPHVTPLR